MAVEARHLNLFPPGILSNRELMVNGVEGSGNIGIQMAYGVVAPLSGITTATDATVPMYGSAFADTVPVKSTAIKSDSGLTYAMPVSRKRSRDMINPLLSSFPNVMQNQSTNNRCSSFTFLGEDISLQIQQQQMEIDRFISQHTEKVRMEMEERRRRYSRRIAVAVEENIMKKLKTKEEEIEKIGKLNWALEERVKSLCVENQIWRDLAQTNEATANALRCDLEQVLAQVQDEQQQQQLQRHHADEAALMDDAQSCCGSNFQEIDPRTLMDNASTVVRDRGCYNSLTNEGCIATRGDKHGMINGGSDRMCRSCGKEESCVLLLPCRHLCLCTICGSSLHTCPVCNSIKTASLHVNLSPHDSDFQNSF